MPPLFGESMHDASEKGQISEGSFSSGCLIRVKNVTKGDFKKVKEVLAVSNQDVDKSEDLVFIVPRSIDRDNPYVDPNNMS